MIRKHISNNDKNYTCIILLNEADKAWMVHGQMVHGQMVHFTFIFSIYLHTYMHLTTG